MNETSSGSLRTRSPMQLLLSLGVLTPLVMFAFVIAAGMLTAGHNFVSGTLSQLGTSGTPFPVVMNTGFIICGLLLLGFSYGLRLRLGLQGAGKALWVLLIVAGVGTVLAGVAHADAPIPGQAVTLEGNLHNAFAGIAYLALVTGMIVFAILTRCKPAWRWYAYASWAVVVLNSALLVVLVVDSSSPFEGALQLAFSGISLAWLAAVALRCLWRPADACVRESAHCPIP